MKIWESEPTFFCNLVKRHLFQISCLFSERNDLAKWYRRGSIRRIRVMQLKKQALYLQATTAG